MITYIVIHLCVGGVFYTVMQQQVYKPVNQINFWGKMLQLLLVSVDAENPDLVHIREFGDDKH